MAVFIIDTEKPDGLDLLADLIAKKLNFNFTPAQKEWVDEKEAREILGGGKAISRKTLLSYREKIIHRQLGARSYLYNRDSIMKFIEER